MSNKDLYLQFCKTEKSIPVFSQPWWLDAACGEINWDVAVVSNGERILGTLPYYMKSKFGLKILSTPKLTQTLGPWIAPSTAKYAKQLSQQKNILTALIEQLPSHHYFTQSCHHSITNWLPFYWKGFKQMTRYSYIIEDLSDLEGVWKETLPKVKTDVRKAQKTVDVKDNLSLEEFYRIVLLTYQRQGRKTPYSFDCFAQIYDACEKNNAGKLFFGVDQSEKIHSVAFIVWDSNTAYYLIGGGDPNLRNSGATSLCLWNAIRFAATVTKGFDFEGSMVEPIERFFRGFGARQVPYLAISKSNSKLISLYQALRGE